MFSNANKRRRSRSKKAPSWSTVPKVVDRKPKRTTVLVCSRCGARESVEKWSVVSKSRPHCSTCGGPLNKPSQA